MNIPTPSWHLPDGGDWETTVIADIGVVAFLALLFVGLPALHRRSEGLAAAVGIALMLGTLIGGIIGAQYV